MIRESQGYVGCCDRYSTSLGKLGSTLPGVTSLFSLGAWLAGHPPFRSGQADIQPSLKLFTWLGEALHGHNRHMYFTTLHYGASSSVTGRASLDSGMILQRCRSIGHQRAECRYKLQGVMLGGSWLPQRAGHRRQPVAGCFAWLLLTASCLLCLGVHSQNIEAKATGVLLW